MSKASERFHRRRESKKQLTEISKNRNNVIVIHYSCESFYNRLDGTSPRITSIAVRNLATGQMESFSIHQIAERDKKLSIESINVHYDELEKKMLKDFYDHAEKHKNYTWLHWNMRDINYGFAALEHRYKVLGGEPFDIQESRLCDLARLLDRLYGVNYIDRPHLENLMKKNSITDFDFLNGSDEAKAFEDGEYAKMHQSTLRKVAVISDIANRAAGNTLITKNSDGSSGRGIKNWLRRLHITGSIASITSWFQSC